MFRPPKPACMLSAATGPAMRAIHGPLTKTRVPIRSPLLIRSRMLRLSFSGAPRSIDVVTPAISSCLAAVSITVVSIWVPPWLLIHGNHVA